MASTKAIIALDLGTTKFCIGYLDPQHPNKKIQLCEVPAKGMHRGMLANFSEAREALNELIEKSENLLGVDIRKIVVGVAGSHLKGSNIHKEIAIQDSFIRQKHIDDLTSEVESMSRDPQRELLHCIPVDFVVDDREAILNPVGLSGAKLTGRYFVIDADKNYLKDLVRLCNQSGLEVNQLFSEPFASASVTVHDQLKTMGVAVADIGGGTTDGIIFQNGRPVDMFTINTAGNHVNRDLSVGLNIPMNSGLDLKENYGLTDLPLVLDLEDIHGYPVKVTQSQITNILQARILELGKFMFHSLVKHQGSLGGGIILTGGGSRLKGIDQFLAQKFGISVRSQCPTLDLDESSKPFSSKHATVIGLLNLEYGRQQVLGFEQAGFWPKKALFQFVNWIRDLS